MSKRFKGCKDKAVQNHPARKQENNESAEEASNMQPVVRGRVEIDLVHDFREQYQAQQSQNTTTQQKQLRWTKIGSILVAIYTAIMLLQAWLVWESFGSVQRAFIKLGAINNTHALERTNLGTQGLWLDSVMWENIGNTPAVGVVGAFSVDELPNGEPDGEIFLGSKVPDHLTSFTIGPRSQQQSGQLRKPDQFFTDGIDTARTTPLTRNIYFWGWTVYRDTFPFTKSHLTEFCLKVSTVGYHAPPERF